MTRFKYPPGHPCYFDEPEVIECEGGCPDGQICDEETGLCIDAEGAPVGDEVLSEAASMLDGFYSDGNPIDEVSEEGLPFPNEQITYEENNIQFASRDKIVANQGCAYWIWDSPAARFRRESLDETILSGFFSGDWEEASAHNRFWGFPGQSAIFQDPMNKLRSHNYDPLRWSTGKVWTHRNPNHNVQYPVPVFVFPSTFSEEEHKDKYFLKFVEPENSPPATLYRDASGNYSDETIYLQYGGTLFSTMEEGNKLSFFKKMLVGTDSIDHTVNPSIHTIPGGAPGVVSGEALPKTREEIVEIYDDSELVNETLEAKFFSRGALGDETSVDLIGDDPTIVPKTYVDFAHKTQMPFFDKESKKMNIFNGLSADIEVHRNFFSKEFQSTNLGPSEDIFKIPNCYRHYRERKRPDENCELTGPQLAKQVDRILKFSAGNIKEMNQVTEEYKKVYPVTAQIRFDTTQKNTVSDTFTRYGMDKYFLDQREKFLSEADALSPSVHIENNLDVLRSTSGQLERESMNEFYYSYDIGGYSIFRVRTYAEYLNQLSVKKEDGVLQGVDDYMTTARRLKYRPKGAAISEVDNRAFNMSTEMRTAYLEDFVHQLRRTEGALSDQLYDKFDDNMFPLGVMDTSTNQEEQGVDINSANWRKTINDFNREVFTARLTGLPYENINDTSPGDPTSFGKYSRSFKDIMNGKLAYSEVLGYSIEKYEHTSGEQGEQKNLVQKFYFFDSSDVTEINFLDNQLRYNKKYTYVIKAINCVFGSEYYYKIENQAKLYENGRISESDENFNFVDEYLLGDASGDVAERSRRFMESFSNSFAENAHWSRHALAVRVRTKPRIAFIEVPYFKKTINTVDLPPLPPQVEILPYKDDVSRVLINLTPSAGSLEAIPRPILSTDTAKIESMYRTQDIALYKRIRGSVDVYSPAAPIKYSGDSMPVEYEMLVLENPSEPPLSVDRFASAKLKRYGNLIAGNLHKDLSLRPNSANYIIFRALDSAGVSVPSDTYYVELVSHQDGMYLVVEEYIYPEQTPELAKVVKNAIEISPTAFQLSRAADQGVSDPFAPTPVNIWDKTYRLNIKSKTTGREINVDFSYEIEAYQEPTPPPILGDAELDAILSTCNKYSDVPQNRADSELYRSPSRINTGSPETVAACPTGPVKQFEFYISSDQSYETDLQKMQILRNSVPVLDQSISAYSRRLANGDCGCPPGMVYLDTISGADNLSNLIYDKNVCVSESMCPPGSRHTVTALVDGEGNQIGAVLHCQCSGDKEPCKGNCVEPCPEFHTRKLENCGCEAACPSPRIWNEASGTCDCPTGWIDNGRFGCTKPIQNETIKDREYQDVRNPTNELSEEEMKEAQRLGHVSEEVREMMESGMADIEEVLEMSEKLKSDGGIINPKASSGLQPGVGTPRQTNAFSGARTDSATQQRATQARGTQTDPAGGRDY